MKKQFWVSMQIVLLSLFAACTSKKFDGPEYIGGQLVSGKTLNVGYDTYMRYCFQCHGVAGDGKGPASYGMNPQPRNFQQGLFKFGSVTSGELPTDEDLKRTIRYGLKGTQMLPWDLSDERLNAVVQYIKTFSPAWKTAKAGSPQSTTADPWGPEMASAAIMQGKKIYHGLAQCQQCHPHYATLAEIDAYSKEITGNGVDSLRENPELSVLQDSSYGHKFMPPDYTKSPIKSLRNGEEIASIYRVLGAGVGGTSMPAWKGMMSPKGDEAESEKNLWALSYYVHSLHQLKYNEDARKKFFTELNAKRNSKN